MKRYSWTALYLDEDQEGQFKKEDLLYLDDLLHEHWALGANLILCWAPSCSGIQILVVPHYRIGEPDAYKRPIGKKSPNAGSGEDLHHALREIMAGSKMVPTDVLLQISERLLCSVRHIQLPFRPGDDLPLVTINSLIKRYSITYVEDRAVALFDAVGFSHYSPLEQAVQLNSLAYSVNTAYSKLLDREIKIRFARTTTGDGFYIWNRDRSLDANVDLYHFMHLVLADNAIARSKARLNTAPLLRACFHVGGHYEFYQTEGLNPTTFSYIVGDVTIELARMIEQSRPGQILVGDFNMPIPDKFPGKKKKRLNAIEFIRASQGRLTSLEHLVLGGEPVQTIKCYLTGSSRQHGNYDVNKYTLKDKHGYLRNVFNAKVNIYRKNGEPIFLGIQDAELSDFGVMKSEE